MSNDALATSDEMSMSAACPTMRQHVQRCIVNIIHIIYNSLIKPRHTAFRRGNLRASMSAHRFACFTKTLTLGLTVTYHTKPPCAPACCVFLCVSSRQHIVCVGAECNLASPSCAPACASAWVLRVLPLQLQTLHVNV